MIAKQHIEERLKTFIDEMGFGPGNKGEVLPTDKLIDDLGMDSLDVAELSMKIDKEYSIVTDYDDYLRMGTTVGEVVDYVDCVLNPIGV